MNENVNNGASTAAAAGESGRSFWHCRQETGAEEEKRPHH